MGNPHGGFSSPWFPGRNAIWNVVLMGRRLIEEPCGKEKKKKKKKRDRGRPFIKGLVKLKCPR